MFKSRSDTYQLPFDQSDRPLVRTQADIRFERLYLVLAGFSEAALLPSMLHPQPGTGEVVHLIAEAVVFLIAFPFFAVPYWMALAITRAKSKMAKYYLHGFVFVLDFVAVVEIAKHGLGWASLGFLISAGMATLGLASLHRVPLMSRLLGRL